MTLQRIEIAARIIAERPPNQNFFTYKGRLYSKVTKIVKISPGNIEITTHNGVYKLDGGKHGGGARTDWFLSGPHIGIDSKGRNYMSVRGLQDALKLLEHEL